MHTHAYALCLLHRHLLTHDIETLSLYLLKILGGLLAHPRIETDKEGQFPFVGKDFYLLLDMQLGGNWVGQVDPADLPVEMEIDWVRFYRKDK